MSHESSTGHDCPPWAPVTNYWAALSLLLPGPVSVMAGQVSLVTTCNTFPESRSPAQSDVVALVYSMSLRNTTPNDVMSAPLSVIQCSYVSLSVEFSKYILMMDNISLTLDKSMSCVSLLAAAGSV